MASLRSHTDVYNTCLLLLRQKGYKLWVEGDLDPDGCVSPLSLSWKAKKDGYDFQANNPIELLGLISLYELKAPSRPSKPQWWKIDGPDLYQELLNEAILWAE
jgi:hypothetical protein